MGLFEESNIWEIRDDQGVIHSGRFYDMDTAWDVLTSGTKEEYVRKMMNDCEDLEPEDLESLFDKYHVPEWKGDLKLVEVHKIHR